MKQDVINRIETALCRFMLLFSFLGAIWSSLVITSIIALPIIKNPVITNRWKFGMTIFSIVMLCITLFWILFAIAERTGLLDRLENQYMTKSK